MEPVSKAPKTEPRQAFESTVEPFAVTEVLQFNSGGHAVLLGEIAGSPALRASRASASIACGKGDAADMW